MNFSTNKDRTRPTKTELVRGLEAISRFPKIAIIDLEATCTDNLDHKKVFFSEILEFGICILDLHTKQVDKTHQVYVKPQISAITPFCEELTGINYAKVADSLFFREAYREVITFLKKEKVPAWASFGAYDRSMIRKQCEFFNVHINELDSVPHFNVKDLVWSDIESKKGPGMSNALAHYGLSLEGRHHSGVDDAKNISKLLVHLLNKH